MLMPSSTSFHWTKTKAAIPLSNSSRLNRLKTSPTMINCFNITPHHTGIALSKSRYKVSHFLKSLQLVLIIAATHHLCLKHLCWSPWWPDPSHKEKNQLCSSMRDLKILSAAMNQSGCFLLLQPSISLPCMPPRDSP